ncbi:MAG: F0F1 ATP synthase subunit B [Actinobacteria bacterium]|nr:F0F1 ATP synthase subunit B [Actinomycetota bacterium]
MFTVEKGLIIWTAISFLILLFLLSKFALKPLLEMMQKREDTIKNSLETAERTRLEAEKLLREYEAQVANASTEAQQIIAQGKKIAEDMKNDIVEKAQQEADKLISKAKSTIEHEREEALNELKNKVADLAVDIASKLIEKPLNTKEHYRLIDKYISEVPEFHEN